MGPVNYQAAGRVAAKRRLRAKAKGKYFSIMNYWNDYKQRHNITGDAWRWFEKGMIEVEDGGKGTKCSKFHSLEAK